VHGQPLLEQGLGDPSDLAAAADPKRRVDATDGMASLSPMPRRRRFAPLSWKPLLLYGAALAAGVLGLDWIQYQRLARTRSSDIALFLLAAAFLALGLYVGARLFSAGPAPPAEGNPRAQASLGISAAELRVLHRLAEGLSNREIATTLHISPHTVKSHVARLYEKLGAKRRTDAVARARSLGILP
jgi:DNA-binding CsgD family transcriptional regulator